MKEHPILFSSPMVRAILEGRKTQTRRVVQLPVIDKDFGCELSGGNLAASQRDTYRYCPYGQPGDRLWVRETWRMGETNTNGLDVSQYRVLDGEQYWRVAPNEWLQSHEDSLENGRWRPSIHMPRWASRLTLEITDVRVQRVQDIGEMDAVAEGVQSFPFPGPTTPRVWFHEIWDSINAKRGFGWDKNPWVWAISFKRVTPPRPEPPETGREV